MNKRILLGVDTSLSPPTQHALRVTSELLAQSSQDVRLVLLHVIPVPYDTSRSWGTSSRALRPFPPRASNACRQSMPCGEPVLPCSNRGLLLNG
jgi:hypothetical protein